MEKRIGFYPALGTPLTKDGVLIEDSYCKQIDMMIDAGAQGVLCMGSMGNEAALTYPTYRRTAQVAEKAVNGRVPLFIGAMDNSVFRVKERIGLLEGVKFDGLVLTTPFYSMTTEDKLIAFFKECADASPVPVYLYDLPVVTKMKITYPMMQELAKHPNIKGIKTGDIVLARLLHLHYPELDLLFSNLDIFDVACSFGLPGVLDGMFTCMPVTSARLQKAYEKGDFKAAAKYVDDIINLRNLFAKHRISPGYTVAMNLLGLEGIYGNGFTCSDTTPEEIADVTAMMKEIGEIQ